MMKKLKGLLKNQKGLTLIELLAVIVILAIIASIAVPAIGGIIAKSQDRAILADASNVLSGAKLAIANNECTKSGTDYTCSGPVLKGYVENSKIVNADQITKSTATNGTSEYTITYAQFKNIKNLTVNGIGGSDTTLTEAELRTAMGN